MYSALQSMRARGAGGDPLPDVWEALKEDGIHFRRGHLHLVAAGPGVGKSAFVLNYVIRAKVAALYFSADSDAFTQLSRTLSIATGMHLDQSAQAVRSGELASAGDKIRGLPTRFTYDASPSIGDIQIALEGYEELYGEYPELVVIDNITNVRTGTAENADDPFAGLELMCDELHTLARIHQTAVIALHHVTGPHNTSTKPVSLAGVKGQITRVPEMVLTLHKSETGGAGTDYLRVSAVKNRGGKADPSGESYAELEFDGPHMTITDVKNNTWG